MAFTDLRAYEKNNQKRTLVHAVFKVPAMTPAENPDGALIGILPIKSVVEGVYEVSADGAIGVSTEVKLGDRNDIDNATTLEANRFYPNGGDLCVIKGAVDTAKTYLVKYFELDTTNGFYNG